MNAPTQTHAAAEHSADRLVGPDAADHSFERMTELERLLQQPAKSTTAAELLLDDATFARIETIAKAMAEGKATVPKHLQGSMADCFAVVTQAFEWGMNPYAVAQKTHIVNGALGYEAQLVNAVVQRSGAIVGRFHYEFEGQANALECRVGAVLRGEREITWGEWLNVNAPKVKNSPLWQTNPKQQLGYLQVKNWARLYCPGAILGVYSADELEEFGDDTRPTPAPAPRGPQRKSTKAPPAAAGNAAADPATGEVPPPPPAAGAPAPKAAEDDTKPEGITAGQAKYLRQKMNSNPTTEAEACKHFGVAKLEDLTLDAFDTLRSELLRAS